MMQWDFTFEHQLEMEHEEGREEGREEERLRAIQNMIRYEISKEQILQDYSEEEYERAQASRIAIR